VVETTIGRPRRWTSVAIATLAVGLLAAMALSGHLRENRQFVAFKADGVMREAPAEIDRVELRSGDRRFTFVRAADGWQTAPEGRGLPKALVTSLEESIKFMHVSAPVRVMERAEWAPVGLREFGLDPPGFVAVLYRRDAVVLGAEFGGPNPQKVLQYMKLQGGEQVYLMSRFVGEEWEHALGEASRG
jgi:hypothetical protein